VFPLPKIILSIILSLFISACIVSKGSTYLGYSKSGLISTYDSNKIRLRQIDTINALRMEKGLSTLSFSRELNASAETHAVDIANQQRAWNFGSDYSSPQERSEVAGFYGVLRGENVSETFEGEFEVLKVWLKNALSREILMDPLATHIGLGWFQEENGTIWWVQDIGQKLF
jgi:uncharacterized protein YkwD